MFLSFRQSPIYQESFSSPQVFYILAVQCLALNIHPADNSQVESVLTDRLFAPGVQATAFLCYKQRCVNRFLAIYIHQVSTLLKLHQAHPYIFVSSLSGLEFCQQKRLGEV